MLSIYLAVDCTGEMVKCDSNAIGDTETIYFQNHTASTEMAFLFVWENVLL